MVSLYYNIFKRDASGAPVWVEAVHDLDTAKGRIIELSAESPGQYVVFSQRSGRVVSSGTIVASPAARSAHNAEPGWQQHGISSTRTRHTLGVNSGANLWEL